MNISEQEVAVLVRSYLYLKKMSPNIKLIEPLDDPIYHVDFETDRNHVTLSKIIAQKKALFNHQKERLNKLMEGVLKKIKAALPASEVWFQVDTGMWVGWQNNNWPGDAGSLLISYEPPTKPIRIQIIN